MRDLIAKILGLKEHAAICGHVTVIGTIAGREVARTEQHNLVMQDASTGLDLIIQRLIGNNIYSLNITHGEIGTGSTTPTIGDTGLEAGVARSLPTLQQDYGTQQAILQFFFPDSTLANGTYNEFGTFVDGTSLLGTGQIFNRAVFATPYVKASGQDSTIQVVFSLGQ
jgi:hypothetical protein